MDGNDRTSTRGEEVTGHVVSGGGSEDISTYGRKILLIAQLLYGTGLRILEAMRLRVKDVDSTRNTTLVREAKGNKESRSGAAWRVPRRREDNHDLHPRAEGGRRRRDHSTASDVERRSCGCVCRYMPHSLAKHYIWCGFHGINVCNAAIVLVLSF